MHYAIRHITRFRYSDPITESLMEVRMQPRSDAPQQCRDFRLLTRPHSQIFAYLDHRGNAVYHFDVPGRHQELVLVASARVDVGAQPELPERLNGDSWQAVDRTAESGEHWDMLQPSAFATPTELLADFCREHALVRNGDPLSTLKRINQVIYDAFDYVQRHTSVDSEIDHALESRKGVCQDFAHIMIAAVRGLGIPCRYVSGYLAQSDETEDRSVDGASHAWIEALLPDLGWIGFDPTNNMLAGGRHIRVAIGRDYADVPPSRGVYRGAAESELAVSVKVSPSEPVPQDDEQLLVIRPMPAAAARAQEDEFLQQQQQQQQQ